MDHEGVVAPRDSILIVEDDAEGLRRLQGILKTKGDVRPVLGGWRALEAAVSRPPDLVLLDIQMPVMDGFEVCQRFKGDERLKKVPIIFLSGYDDVDTKVRAFESGGVDYITKPYEEREVMARVDTHLNLRKLQVRLEDLVGEKVKEISDSQVATIVALATLAERRDEDTGQHIRRVQEYCRIIAAKLAESARYGGKIDDEFIANIYHASAMHDIGKVGVPDNVLLKKGKLEDDEAKAMKSHVQIGADTLLAVIEQYPNNRLVAMGREIALTHHERWDGSGYPGGLKGEEIPLEGRIMNIADQYDALRNKRPYKPAMDAEAVFYIITVGDRRTLPEHFDPDVLSAFKEAADELDRVCERFQDK